MLMKAVHERDGGLESVIFIEDDYSQVYLRTFKFLLLHSEHCWLLETISM